MHTEYSGYCYSCAAYRDVLHFETEGMYQCTECFSFEARIVICEQPSALEIYGDSGVA